MSLFLVISLGMSVMILIMLYAGKYRNIPVWKRVVLSVLLTITGVAGTKLMVFIESGSFGGLSYFGAVFFAPVIMVFLGLIFRCKPSDTLDLCAPAECGMLVVMKINCYRTGCCRGRVIATTIEGAEIRFPSQIVEGLAALGLMVVLLLLFRQDKQKGKLYPWYMILYGVTRFLLNLFRETTPFLWILPAGNFWSLVSLSLGLLSLFFIPKCPKWYQLPPQKRRRKKKRRIHA